WFACDVAFQAAVDAVQIHGANGYSHEFPAERYMRNAKAPGFYEGTREIHQIMQGEYALGYRSDKPFRRNLPQWPFAEWDDADPICALSPPSRRVLQWLRP